MNDRVKELRIYLGYTLDEFAAPLGVRKSAISKIERGENAVSDQMARAICREYGVSESWLRNGEGKMFGARAIGDELKGKIDILLADEDEDFRLRLMRMLCAMSKEDVRTLEAYARKYLMREETTIDQKVRDYRHELEAEAFSKESEALQTTNEKREA